MKRRWLRITGIVLLVLVVLLVAASYLVDDPLRRYVERQLNTRLKDYTVRIGRLTTHPLLFAVDLDDLTVIQRSHPEPPLATVKHVRGGLQWRDLFTGHLVGDATIDAPRLHLDIANLKAEIKKPPEKKEAWQDTLAAVTPVTVNEFRIRDGELTYVESRKGKPVTVSGILFTAHNVQNVKSSGRDLPSTLALEADLYGSRITMNGQADLMRKPFAAVRADLDLRELDLARFRDIAAIRGITVSKGTVSGSVHVDVSPEHAILVLNDLVLANAAVDYDYVATPEPKEVAQEKKREAVEKLKQAEREVVNKPGLLIKAKRVRIANSTLGMINLSAKPQYRLFISDMNMELTNFSNHLSEGPADLYLSGKFMGSGETVASGTFRPEKKGPDFDVRIAIKNTSMPALNDLFRAYGKFDVAKGRFSFYSELAVKNDTVTGYVKPLFRDMKVYDKRTDKEKSEFRKLYEKIIGGVAKLLENRPRKAVATETPVKGPLENPKAGTWETLVNIIRNAFFQAILPGFEKNLGAGTK